MFSLCLWVSVAVRWRTLRGGAQEGLCEISSPCGKVKVKINSSSVPPCLCGSPWGTRSVYDCHMHDQVATRAIHDEGSLVRLRASLAQAVDVLRQIARGYLMNPPGC